MQRYRDKLASTPGGHKLPGWYSEVRLELLVAEGGEGGERQKRGLALETKGQPYDEGAALRSALPYQNW